MALSEKFLKTRRRVKKGKRKGHALCVQCYLVLAIHSLELPYVLEMLSSTARTVLSKTVLGVDELALNEFFSGLAKVCTLSLSSHNMPNDHQHQVLQLFVRHQTRIKGFIVSLLGDFAAADDVVQETFLIVQQKSDEFSPGSNFIAWTFQIARFQVMKAQSQRNQAADRFLMLSSKRYPPALRRRRLTMRN